MRRGSRCSTRSRAWSAPRAYSGAATSPAAELPLLRREAEVARVGEPVAHDLGRLRIAAQAEDAAGLAALVVVDHAHELVAGDPVEQAVGEAGRVGTPDRPFGDREGLALADRELLVEAVEAAEVGEARVEARADPVDPLPAGPVHARAQRGDARRAAGHRRPYERDLRHRQRRAARLDGGEADAPQAVVDRGDVAAVHDQVRPLPRPLERGGG